MIPSEITIAGKTFPLRLTSEEVRWVKSLEEEINLKINDFREQYAHLDKVDSIIMTLLTYAFDSKKIMTSHTSPADEDLHPALDDILELLSRS